MFEDKAEDCYEDHSEDFFEEYVDDLFGDHAENFFLKTFNLVQSVLMLERTTAHTAMTTDLFKDEARDLFENHIKEQFED